MRDDRAHDRVLLHLCAAAIVMVLMPLLAGAQQASDGTPAKAPEAPFVSRLRADVADSQIRLTWKDSPDVMGAYLVYRAAAEITPQTLAQATPIGQVDPGVQSFLDAPPDLQGYYYAVVARDTSGKLYPLIIQFRNKTSAAAAAQPKVAATVQPPTAETPATATAESIPAETASPAAAVSAAPAVAVPASPSTPVQSAPPQATQPGPAKPVAPPPADDSIPALITGIAAALTASGDSVSITFRASNPRRELLLFWASAPLTAPVDLLRSTSTVALDVGTTRYVLPAPPGSTYWFAVLDAGLYKLGQAPLVKGANTTTAAIHVPAGGVGASLAAAPAARRVQPLPSLDLDFGIQTGTVIADGDTAVLPPEKGISPATAQAISLLLKGIDAQPAAERSPQVLPANAAAGSGGELASLQEIVKGPFRSNDMPGAQQKLLDFLSLPRAAQVEAHARFYLGQTYYFQGRMRDALMEFLMSADSYYLENQPWLDACLLKLERENN